MVQYVFTPWRNRQELLLVRQQFYSTSPHHQPLPSHSGATLPLDRRGLTEGGDASAQHQDQHRRRRDQHDAVARVSMWMQRGSCPHMVESTALLTAAVLSDEAVAPEQTAASAYAIRAAYSAAFSRFVTGLLDGHQDKQRKQSMYSIAKTIGLPATFVELRHQSTHEQLPSRAKLRSAAKQALAWIWDYYWKHLQEDPKALSTASNQSPCADAVLKYLREEDEARRQAARAELRAWPRNALLRTIADLQTTMPGNQAYLKCLKLSKELMAEESGHTDELAAAALEEGSEDIGAQREKPRAFGDFEAAVEAERDSATGGSQPPALGSGWAPYTGVWKPKPIGMV